MDIMSRAADACKQRLADDSHRQTIRDLRVIVDPLVVPADLASAEAF
jgi:hypothetical protein